MLILVYYYIYTVMLSVSVVETSGRNAPRASGAVNGIKPFTEEDCFYNSPSLFEKPCLCTQHKTQITIYNPLADKQRKYAAEGKIRREGIFHAIFFFTRGCNA